MTEQQIDKVTTLYTYCGLTFDRAMDLCNHVTGNTIHPHTLLSFRTGGLIDANGALTLTGKTIKDRAAKILGDYWVAPESELNGPFLEELERVDLRTLRSHQAVKAHGLRAIHLKILRSLALRPAQVYGAMRNVYGDLALQELYDMRMTLGGTTYYSLVILANKGMAFVLQIMAGNVPDVKIEVVVK